MEPHRCYITGVAAVRFKRSTLCITKFRKHGTTPPVTFVPGPMKNVIARCFKPFDRVERSERERSSIPNLFLSLSLSLSSFFSFFNEIALVLQRGKFTERQWNIVRSGRTASLFPRFFIPPSYVSPELFWSSFSSSSFSLSLSLSLFLSVSSNSRCSRDVFVKATELL